MQMGVTSSNLRSASSNDYKLFKAEITITNDVFDQLSQLAYNWIYNCYQNIIVLIQMNFNQQLYQQYIERRNKKIDHQNTATSSISKKRHILKKLLELPDQMPISLDSSISLLKQLQIISKIETVDHIVNIMQNKKRQMSGWEGEEQQLSECRFIYFMWAVIEEEVVEMRQFKEIIIVLINTQKKDRLELIKQTYGDKDGIAELIQSWDSLIQSTSHKDSFNQSSSQQINDISIIKSKNQGSIGENKENFCNINSSHKLPKKYNLEYGVIKSPNYQKINIKPLEKSFQKKASRTNLNHSGSIGKMTAKSSEGKVSNIYAHSGVKIANFFTSSQNLTPLEQKKLVQRLYNIQKYKQRQELKRKIEQERIKVQLDQCTFKPSLYQKTRVMSKSKIGSKDIKGYNKAIQRMKVGYQKNKEMKQNLQYRIWKQPINPQKMKPFSVPKFLSRTKQVEVQLFQIVFTIGRHNIRIKIRQSDRVNDIVNNIGQIYSLKEQLKDYIRTTLEQQLNKFYQQKIRLEQAD